ncbi:efflux RND transporter periplasmic adaptor subunit [Sulfuricaulis sp.]|jgi:macrolide-specific efflux system membrane fusion protein|uniref:efflux RND transporter periplasmic adaptor subunit n=1 Tax=Sulfuricaulis sp. TaxID=2003553 RepID=UPI003559F331
MLEAMRSRRMVVVAAVLVLAIAGGAAVYWISGRNAQPVYRELTVSRGDLEVTILSTGTVAPKNRLDIKAPIPGRAEQVLVDEGYKVTKGQILAWMSSTERAALIDAARAKGPDELKHWEELYRSTPILAPVNGTIITRNVEAGQTFTSADAIFVMSDYLIVLAQVDETDLAQIRLGQPASIVLDAYPDQSFTGKVDEIAFDAKTVNNVTTYSVNVLPDKTPTFMRSGMTANVSFVTASRRNVLLVPGDALKSRDGHMYVLLPPKKPNGSPIEKEIKVGLSDGKRTEVLEGVAEGEKLLALRLQTGARSDAASSPFMPFGRKR